jgi:hypothetical protein
MRRPPASPARVRSAAGQRVDGRSRPAPRSSRAR